MNGLSLEIKAKVMSRHPVGLDECMVEAQVVNDRNLALKLAEEELGLSKLVAQQQTGKQVEVGGAKTQRKTQPEG